MPQARAVKDEGLAITRTHETIVRKGPTTGYRAPAGSVHVIQGRAVKDEGLTIARTHETIVRKGPTAAEAGY